MKHSLRLTVFVARIFSVVSCSSGGGPGTSAATISSAPASDNAEQTITRLEQDWVAAIVKKDTATLDRLHADACKAYRVRRFVLERTMQRKVLTEHFDETVSEDVRGVRIT